MILLEIHLKTKEVKKNICTDVAISGCHLYFTPYLKRQFEVMELEDLEDIVITETN